MDNGAGITEDFVYGIHRGNQPNQSFVLRYPAGSIALDGRSVGDDDLYVMINAHWEDRDFLVHIGEPSEWRLVVDTARSVPDDILEPGREVKLDAAKYPVRARSVVVLRRDRS